MQMDVNLLLLKDGDLIARLFTGNGLSSLHPFKI